LGRKWVGERLRAAVRVKFPENRGLRVREREKRKRKKDNKIIK
jgi:hypothetical protein